MEIAGRLCQAPIQKHWRMAAFHRNAQAIASIFSLVWFVQAGSLRAADIKIWQEFSGEKAFTQVQRLVDFGPRPVGSKAIEKSRDYIEDQLRRFGWRVTRQAFSDDTPRGKTQFVNLIAQFPGQGNASSPIFLLCSHYDTKTFDTVRFVGADDGGSSTGLLLELARVIGQHPDLARKIELVFFDGEEAFEQFSQTDGLYGSRYFARQLKGPKQFRGGLLFDMVGDRSLGITLPSDSPAEMAGDVFAAAEALKLRNYFTYLGRELIDDHTPLNAIGIPTLDIIDFDYPWWHTAGDTMDKISAQSLQTVGSVALYYLAEIALKR
jgi:peptidase M28-like protein